MTVSADLSEKLDILIKLQAASLVSSMDSLRERIVFLSKAGLRPNLIAEILGTTANHVSVELSKSRKSSKKSGSK